MADLPPIMQKLVIDPDELVQCARIAAKHFGELADDLEKLRSSAISLAEAAAPGETDGAGAEPLVPGPDDDE